MTSFVEAWHALKPHQQRVIIMRCQGMTNGDIAARDEVETGMVRGVFARALAKLKGPLNLPHSSNSASHKMLVVCWNLGYMAGVNAEKTRKPGERVL